MDCRMTQGELVAYYFGTATDDAREAIDAHLLGCTGCLRVYLRIKRQVERGAIASARPSDAVRRRVREDVAAVVRPRGAARLREVLRRPIPLYQGLAVAAVAAGLAVGLPSLLAGVSHREPQPEARVDTSRPVPESLTIY